MGWQTLTASLRRWDSGKPSAEKDATLAVEELLAVGDDENTLRMFAEALDPSLSGNGTQFLHQLAKTNGAKCRCDAVWYGDTIAYGCKTCGLSSASCICVFCFDAGEHEGHDFYISRSDYGCCDCGDAYAWRRSGFCKHHPGPDRDRDPTQLLPEATRKRAQLLIPLQVRRLTQQFKPDTFPTPTPASASSFFPAPPAGVSSPRQVCGKGNSPPKRDEEIVFTVSTRTDPSLRIRALVTGINLRMTDGQLKDHFGVNIELVRDPDTKASRGRAYVTLNNKESLERLVSLSGDLLRGSKMRVFVFPSEVEQAERYLKAWESNFEWLLALGGFHDGLRRIIGNVFLDPFILGGECAVEVLLRISHSMEPSVRKLETNLMVDLMLDLSFKHRFAQIFTRLYPELVRARAGQQDNNELGDFTCQIFTRQDVTLELVRNHGLVENLLDSLWNLLQPALRLGATPPVFNHESNVFKDHEIIQCSMDLLYVLDHADVAREIVLLPNVRTELWTGWTRILLAMQDMNAHQRREGSHVEYPSPCWGNALTLHTDIMSNTWLIVDAVGSVSDPEIVKDLARRTWQCLREWISNVHAEEKRFQEAARTVPLEFEVSRKPTSFHVPLNRLLALLLYNFSSRDVAASGVSESGCKNSAVHAAFAAVGMSEESDVLSWLEHPLRALALHAQVYCGMWRRNGEALENENEFYRMNYWHHLLIDVDLLILRMSAMLLSAHSFFAKVLTRFELVAWLQPGDVLKQTLGEEFGPMKLQSFVLLLYHLLNPFNPLSVSVSDLVTHTTRQFLSIEPKSHSHLWDPRLERSTATSTAKDQKMLEKALSEISTFAEADDSGHTSAKYHLKKGQWTSVDPFFHLFSWTDQQKSEENLVAALKARDVTMLQWLEDSAAQRPLPFEAYRSDIHAFSSSCLLQAFCWILLAHLAFKNAQKGGPVADGRLLVLALHLAFRCALTPTGSDGRDDAAKDTNDEIFDVVCVGAQDILLMTLAGAMGSHLCESARRRVRVDMAIFFDDRVLGSVATALGGGKPRPAQTEMTLLHVVDRLCTIPEETVPGALARALRHRLLQDPKNDGVVESHPRPWFMPPLATVSANNAEGNANTVVDNDQGSSGLTPKAGSVDYCSGMEVTEDDEESRKIKRRKAAQERQQRMLNDLKRRQAAFMTGFQMTNIVEEAETKSSGGAVGGSNSCARPECVVCIAQQEGEDSDNPLGLLCYMRAFPAGSIPRKRVPHEATMQLQARRKQVDGSHGSRGPQCFSPQAVDGMVFVRSCSHRMHFACWRRVRAASAANTYSRLTCPYCGTAVNALLPMQEEEIPPQLQLPARVEKGDGADGLSALSEMVLDDGMRGIEVSPPSPSVRSAMSDSSVPACAEDGMPVHRSRHPDASADFEECLQLQLAKFDSWHLPSLSLALAIGLSPATATNWLMRAKLIADGSAHAEVRLRGRPGMPAVPTGTGCAATGSSASSSAPPPSPSKGPSDATSSQIRWLRLLATESVQCSPDVVEGAVALITGAERRVNGYVLKLADFVQPASSSPHGRLQVISALLVALCSGADRGANSRSGIAARDCLRGAYIGEAAIALAGLVDQAVAESELVRAKAAGASLTVVLWKRVLESVPPPPVLGCGPPAGGGFWSPVRTAEKVAPVLRLVLNTFLAKMHLLLSCLGVRLESSIAHGTERGGFVSPEEEHQSLALPLFGIPTVEELLFIQQASRETTTDHSAAAFDMTRWLGTGLLAGGGSQPLAPVLLVIVVPDEGNGALSSTGEDVPPPRYVWQVSPEGFERLVAGRAMEAVDLTCHSAPVRGRLMLVTYRSTLPVVTGKVYQKFYTQFVHARCQHCETAPPIPTLCLLCGSFLCCNSECCRQREASTGHTIGEVTHHAQQCGFGTCVFLQLSNSLVHIVADGYIACWGSLYLDHHGEEEYNLSRPLHISEARLQQLTQSVREVSFDFESRLKWKKWIFV